MRTTVYIDGFSLHCGALKGSPRKWLDLVLLFEAILQRRHDVDRVKCFTARVSDTLNDPSKAMRQGICVQALRRFRPTVQVCCGHFLSHRVRMPLVQPQRGRRTVEVVKTEEKGSDVNLAAHLVNDAWLNAYDCAVVVSNDSDIAEAMRLVKEHHPAKRIGLLLPRTGSPSRQLRKHADFTRPIRTGAMANSQLPDPIPGTNIRKPAAW